MASFSGFGTFRKPTAAYQQIGLSSDVTTADPHRLILLLFEGADAALNTASFCMKEGNIPGKGQAISKAISIINDGLLASLDVDAGGELGERLYSLYEYMVDRLLWANLKNDEATLQEVRNLLGTIHSAWLEIRPQVMAMNNVEGKK